MLSKRCIWGKKTNERFSSFAADLGFISRELFNLKVGKGLENLSSLANPNELL